MKYLFIDIRKSDEVYSNRFDKSSQYDVYNIPMNMIRFNREMIVKHLEYIDEIYVVCHSAARSQFIKDKYFSEVSKIKVNKNLQFKNLKHGLNQVKLNDAVLDINIVGSNSFNLYNMMRIIQVVLGTIILLLGGYTYYKVMNKNVNRIPLLVLLAFGLMALFNGLTSTCTISIILRDYLN